MVSKKESVDFSESFLKETDIKIVEDEFAKIGISLKDNEGQFKSMAEIFKECFEVWQNFSSKCPQKGEPHV